MAYVTMKTIYWKITKYLVGSTDINLMGTQALLGLIQSQQQSLDYLIHHRLLPMMQAMIFTFYCFLVLLKNYK